MRRLVITKDDSIGYHITVEDDSYELPVKFTIGDKTKEIYNIVDSIGVDEIIIK